MLTALNWRKSKQRLATVLLVGAGVLSFSAISDGSAEPDLGPTLSVSESAIHAPSSAEPLSITSAAPASVEDAVLRGAVSRFIKAVRHGDSHAVWMFASEEDQEAFSTEEAVLAAFTETFPVLTQAAEVSFERFWDQGETPFAELVLRDEQSNSYRAEIGLFQDDAGDWKVVSCDINAVSDQVAALDGRF